MGLLRRNKDKKEPEIPVPENNLDSAITKTPSEAEPPASIFVRGKQYAYDSYNGVYKIVLEPSMPTKATIILLVVGVIIGLLWAWLLNPPIFYNADISQLDSASRDDWVKTVASSYALGLYDEEVTQLRLDRIEDPQGTVERLIATTQGDEREVLEDVLPLTNGLEGTAAPHPSGFLGELFAFLLPIILVVVITPILLVIWRLLFYPNVVLGINQRIKMARDPEYRAEVGKQRAELARLQEMKRAKDTLRQDTSNDTTNILGQPAMTQLSIFTEGRTYDDSFEIELGPAQGNKFLGQCGATISESISPNQSAVEIWLFDISSQEDLRKVFVSPTINPAYINQLAADVKNPSTDLISPDETLEIVSNNLILHGKLKDVTYREDGQFKGFNLQLFAWQKQAEPVIAPVSTAPAYVPPAAAPIIPPASEPMRPDYETPAYQAPVSSGFSTPSGSVLNPPSAFNFDDIEEDDDDDGIMMPPANFDSPFGRAPEAFSSPPPPAPSRPLFPTDEEDDDNDPFGGSGDFTPSGSF
ncbi:hypothetical protein MASR2M15_23270 [Anaerolineales bacterium]